MKYVFANKFSKLKYPEEGERAWSEKEGGISRSSDECYFIKEQY